MAVKASLHPLAFTHSERLWQFGTTEAAMHMHILHHFTQNAGVLVKQYMEY